MTNEDQTVWTIFNGEIYNHKELRHKLQARGHVFKGYSDTEVLPHLYEEEGPGFVSRLRGMFAIAIYDMRSRSLVLARDRFGIKPLFYAPGKERLAFASEIRTLLKLPGIDFRPNRQAIYDFAALFHIPAPETFYIGILALQPGEVLEARLDSDGVVVSKVQKYHQWVIAPDWHMSLSEAIDRTDDLLMAAVEQQLESDVALGSLLSGGIDSSLISAAAQTSLQGGVRTFNVQFPEKEYDETWAATAAASHIGSSHETLSMEHSRGTWDHITGLLLHAGQPFADTSLFAVSAICRLMRSRVTVALSGDGGDEAFGGYDIYWRIAQIARCQKMPAQLWLGGAAFLGPLAKLGLIPERLPRRIHDLAGADNTSVIQTLWCWIREHEHARLCRDRDLLPVRRLFEPQWIYDLPKKASRLEYLSAQASEVSTRLILPNDFLFKVDIASMKEGLEIRVPFLDEELFAFAISLPHRLKVTGRTGKRILREVARRRLPDMVADKPKRGFDVPIDTWTNNDFKEHLRDFLLRPSSRLPEFFLPEVYKPMVDAFCDDRPFFGISRQSLHQRAIMLLSVELAMERDLIDRNLPYAA